MNEENKIELNKLFHKYATIGAVSGNEYLTITDFNFLISDKSFPLDAVVSDDFGGKIAEVKKAYWDGTLKGRIMELEHLILMEKKQALNIEVLESRLKKWHDSQNSR